MKSKTARGYNNLGNMLRGQGDLDSAVLCFHRALALNPGDAEGYLNLGVAFHQQGQLEAAGTSYRKALCLQPDYVEAHYNLGLALQEQGQLEAASASYQEVIRLRPDTVEAYNNLGNVFARQGKLDEEIACYEQALRLQPDYAEAHYNLGHALLAQDKSLQAAENFRTVLTLQPDHEEARFFLAVATGTGPPAAVPRDVVRDTFDRYAAWFDTHLRDDLSYSTPETLRQAVGAVAPIDRAGWAVLDLGCGTGLCGPLFRDLAARLVGVDLSPQMLAQALQRGVYDDLREEALLTALQAASEVYDLVLAADVFVYVGDLAPVFAACVKALRSDGWFAFSTEETDEDDFTLRSSGRFAHASHYITALAQRTGFAIAFCDKAVIRMEKGQPLAGHIFVLRKCLLRF